MTIKPQCGDYSYESFIWIRALSKVSYERFHPSLDVHSSLLKLIIYIDSLSKNKAANNGRKSLFFLFGFTRYVTIRNIIQCRHFFQFECRVEGIAQTIIAILGIFGNLVASFILSRREMRNAFNLVSTVQLMILNVINIYRLPINVK